MYRQFSWTSRNNSNRKLSYSSSSDLLPGSSSPIISYRNPSCDIMEKEIRHFKSQSNSFPQHNSLLKNAVMYHEYIDANMWYSFPISDIICHKKSDFQDIKIMKTESFGKCLVMDSHIQSAESDESIYHESLVHPAMLSHPRPEVIFVGGGSELATVREVLKHKTVKRVVMVDIDKEAVELCKEHLHEWNAGVLDDPRVEVIYGDADAFLSTCGILFDVVIMDICEPTEGGPGWKLYTREFYQRIKAECMNGAEAVLCTQSNGINVNIVVENFAIINNTLRSVFSQVKPYRCDIPSFGCPWGFHICSDDDRYILSSETDPAAIDLALRSDFRLSEVGERTLRHYDGECHRHMFNLTKYEREACMDEGRIFSLETPYYVQ